MKLAFVALLVAALGLSVLAVRAPQEDQMIRAWVNQTRNSGWDLQDDYCNWRGFTCVDGSVTSMEISPGVQTSEIIFGNLPDVPAWLAARTSGNAFDQLTRLSFINYRTGPFLPAWVTEQYGQPPFNFIIDTTPSLVCHEEPCPFQATKPPEGTPCDLSNPEAYRRNITCSNANILYRRPSFGPKEGGNQVVIGVNIPTGFMDLKVSFGHLDGFTVPVNVEQMYFLSYIWTEPGNIDDSVNDGQLQYFTSLLLVHAPPHPPGAVDLHLYAGDERFTREFDVQYYYECPPGTIAVTFRDTNNATQTRCDRCPIGSFSNEFGSENCTLCPAGSYNLADGSTNCTQCEPGTYSAVEGANSTEVCLPCEPGSANPLPGQTECPECVPGTHQPNERQLSCRDCPAGSVQPLPGQTNCTKCDPGTFQSTNGETECLLCPVSTYSNIPGAKECLGCPPGQTTKMRRSTSCDLVCQPGTYRPSGTQACLACAPGTYAEEAGLAICTLCNVGFYNSNPNGTGCSQCEANSVNVNRGSTECLRVEVSQTQDDILPLMLGVILLIVAVILIICAVAYIVVKKREQSKRRKELEKLRELMNPGAVAN